MTKYHCDYCGVTLTHDSISVRKAHALGKAHIKYVIDYYENAAKEEGLLPSEMPSSTENSSTANAWLTENKDTHLDQTLELGPIFTQVPGLIPRRTPASIQPDSIANRYPLPIPAHVQSLAPPPQPFYAK